MAHNTKEYSKEYLDKNRTRIVGMQQARRRAKTRLLEIHADEYEELYRQELESAGIARDERYLWHKETTPQEQ